jgi:hypothetical protein
MDELDKQNIENLLQELGQELAQKIKSPMCIMLIGGAYMILFLGNREYTEDVDVFPLNFPTSATPSADTKKFATAARAVARRHQLRKNWLNDSAATMLGGLGPDPTLELWAQFGTLEIYIPPLDFILALKIFADRGKDSSDLDALIQTLNITNHAQLQAIADKYIYQRWQLEYKVDRTINNLARRLKLH